MGDAILSATFRSKIHAFFGFTFSLSSLADIADDAPAQAEANLTQMSSTATVGESKNNETAPNFAKQ